MAAAEPSVARSARREERLDPFACDAMAGTVAVEGQQRSSIQWAVSGSERGSAAAPLLGPELLDPILAVGSGLDSGWGSLELSLPAKAADPD